MLYLWTVQMGRYKQSAFLVISIAILFSIGFGARTSTKIYYDVDTDSTPMCFRRFNGTHQIGCSSDRSGNVGVVYFASNESRMEDLLNANTNLGFTVFMSMNLFKIYGTQMIRSPRVKGVVILNLDDSDQYVPKKFSPDLQCPNLEYGYNGHNDTCESNWNPSGTGLMFEDYPFPIITLRNETVSNFSIKECFEKHNLNVLDYSSGDSKFCGMYIKDAMDGAKDTPTCMRRSSLQVSLSPQHYCEPLGNKNLFSSLRPILSTQKNSVVIVAARLDAFSMFDHEAPGFESAVLSYVTLYAVSEAIGKVKQHLDTPDKHILFVLFHGEAFDYIGSSRMAYDLAEHKMNFTLNDIELFVEIGQVGLHKESESLFAHSRGAEVDAFVSKLQAAGKKLKLDVAQVKGSQLPPASLHSFIKARTNISGVVIANHNRTFANDYYNSIYDKPRYAGLNYPTSLNDGEKYNFQGDLAKHIQKLSTAIAQAIYGFVDNTEAPVECVSNITTVANLLYCYAVNSSCELLNSSYTNTCAANLNRAINVKQHYVGVGHGRTQDYCNIYMLAHFLGDVVDGDNWTQKSCENRTSSDKDGYYYYYVRGDVSNASDPLSAREGRCIRTAASLSDAISPAFLIDGYDWSSREYSSWTESVWAGDAMQVKIFMLPSRNQEITTFAIGVIMLVMSFVVVYFIDRKASVLFPSTPTI